MAVGEALAEDIVRQLLELGQIVSVVNMPREQRQTQAKIRRSSLAQRRTSLERQGLSAISSEVLLPAETRPGRL